MKIVKCAVCPREQATRFDEEDATNLTEAQRHARDMKNTIAFLKDIGWRINENGLVCPICCGEEN
jgi:hypothetical protein